MTSDTEKILQISSAQNPHDDELVWNSESSDIFSVSSVYKLLQRNYPNFIQIISKEYYRKLWNLNIPTKVKIIMLRITNDFFPTRANMFKKRLVVDPMCPICGNGTEDPFHIFCFYPVSKKVWELVGLEWILQFQYQDWERWHILVFFPPHKQSC